MIYRVVLDGVDIYGAGSQHQLLKGTADLELNGAGSCDLTMPYEHEAYDLPRSMKSVIDIYENDTIVWFGRVTDISTNWNNEKKVSAEGALAYFNDSVIRPDTWDDVYVTAFFEDILTRHNEQVPADKQFMLGDISDFAGIKVTRTSNYEKTFDILQEQCIKACGGYLMLRKESDGEGGFDQYIDWFKEIPYNCSQEVAFGINLLDISSNLVSSDIITAAIPLGDDGNGGRITIEGITTDLPEGYAIAGDYIYNIEAVEEYGLILEVVEFNDVTNPLTLIDQGIQYLKSKQFDHITFECNVAELKYLDSDTDAFNIGQNVRVFSNPHFIDKTLAISKISYDISNATKKVTIGTPARQDLSQITASEGGSGSGTVISGGGGSGGGGGGGGGGGSTVSVRPIILTGDDIAIITVNGRAYHLKYDASGKADKSDTYTKTEVDTALALKADSSSVYTKTETDTALALKADEDSVYSKSEVYNKTETYSQAEVNQAIDGVRYSLPIASSSTLGGIKVGSNLSIDQDGVLSAGNDRIAINPLINTGTSIATITLNGTVYTLMFDDSGKADIVSVYTKSETDTAILNAAGDGLIANSQSKTLNVNPGNGLEIDRDSLISVLLGDDLKFETNGALSSIRHIYSGTELPSKDLGETGDIYLRYRWISYGQEAEYEAEISAVLIKLPIGEISEIHPTYNSWKQIASNVVIENGTTEPSQSYGNDGDVYILYEEVVDETSGVVTIDIPKFLQKIEGQWGALVSGVSKQEFIAETTRARYKTIELHNGTNYVVQSTSANTFSNKFTLFDEDFVMENGSAVEMDYELNMYVDCDSYVLSSKWDSDNRRNRQYYKINGDTIIRLSYAINNTDLTYLPTHTVVNGNNVISWHYVINYLEKQVHNFKVYLEIMNGKTTIPAHNIVANISGTGLDDSGFSGVMVGKDTIPYVSFTRAFASYTESSGGPEHIPVSIPDTSETYESVQKVNFHNVFSVISDSLEEPVELPEPEPEQENEED